MYYVPVIIITNHPPVDGLIMNLNQLTVLLVQAHLKITDDAIAFDNVFAFDTEHLAFDNEWI